MGEDPYDDEEEAAPSAERSTEEQAALARITDELNEFLDIPLTVKAELGRADLTVNKILQMEEGIVMYLSITTTLPLLSAGAMFASTSSALSLINHCSSSSGVMFSLPCSAMPRIF